MIIEHDDSGTVVCGEDIKTTELWGLPPESIIIISIIEHNGSGTVVSGKNMETELQGLLPGSITILEVLS